MIRMRNDERGDRQTQAGESDDEGTRLTNITRVEALAQISFHLSK